MRGWTEKHPAMAIGVLSGVPFGVFVGVFAALTDHARLPWLSVGLGALAALLFGTAFGVFMAAHRRAGGGAVIARSVQNSIRRRTLPDAVDDAWLAGLGYRQAQAARYRWATPVIFLFMTALAVISLTGDYVPDWLGWLEVLGFPAIAVLSVLSSYRELRAIADLERQLARRG
jgi:hypothetical protein